MKCPRDRSVLVFTDEGRHPRNKCRQCSGLLVSREEVIAALGGKAPDAAKVSALPESGIACPRDGSSLRRVERHGVEVDLCGECQSVWLDAGEFEKIAAQGKRAKRSGVATAAVVAGGAVAAAAAAQPAQAQSLAAAIAQGAGEIVAEGAIELAIDFVGEAIGSVLGSLF